MPTNKWSIHVEGEKAFVFLCGKRLSRKCKDFGHLKHAETETYKGQLCIKVSLMSLPIQTSYVLPNHRFLPFGVFAQVYESGRNFTKRRWDD